MSKQFTPATLLAETLPISSQDLQHIQRCLVMIPHPDDESLGCAGLICKLRDQGTEFKLILTTDGSASHPNSIQYPPEKLTAIRTAELIKVIHLLELKDDVLECYNSIDSAMPARSEAGFEALASRLVADLNSFKPDLILVPYELDPHRDHRATWQLLMAGLERAMQQRPLIWEYPIWLYKNAKDGDLPKLKQNELRSIDVSQYNEIKKECINAHLSQTTSLINDDPTGFVLLPEMISNFTNGTEYYMQRNKINPNTTIQEDYFETLYTKSTDPWNFEQSKYEKEKYERTVASIPDKKYELALEIGCSIGVFTEILASRCNNLMAMDISKTALAKAAQRLANLPQVKLITGAIPVDFPSGKFDLIVMSEVGYYLSMEDLLKTRTLIIEHLRPNGILLLVHWTHFVVDYPLTGDEVHNCFKQSSLSVVNGMKTDDYRIDVFIKDKFK